MRNIISQQFSSDLGWPLSRQRTLIEPVDVKPALRKQPRAALLYEDVRVAESGDHQAALSNVDRKVVRQGVGLPRASIARQREYRALPDEVHRGGVLVQVVEDGRERRAGVKLLRRSASLYSACL